MIQKKKIAKIVLLVCLLLSFNVFALTPIGNLTKMGTIALSTIGFAFFAIHFRKYPKALRIFGILFILLLFSSILSSHSIHNLPYLKGFIASSDIYLIGLVFLMHFMIMRYKITLEEIKRMVLRTSWVLFFLYLIMFVLHIGFFSADGKDFFGVETLRKGFITFGSLIYMTKFFKENHSKYLLYSIILFSACHFGDFQRFVMAVYITTLVILMFLYARRAVALKVTMALAIIVPIATIVITTTDLGITIQQKVADASEIFDEEKQTFSDHSIYVRVWQTEAAVKSIEKYPLTGVGRMGNDDIQKAVGLSYFHVSDIGLIGTMFSFGIFGMFIFFYQIRYLALGMIKRRTRSIPPLVEIKFFMLFILLHTILTGRSMNTPLEFVMLVSFIEIGSIRAQLALEEHAT